MSKIRVWSVAANHGHYGNDLLCSTVNTDKRSAIYDCLGEIIRHTQPEEKKRLINDSEKIVEELMSQDVYLQCEDGLRMTAEWYDLEIEMALCEKIKSDGSDKK